MPKNRFSHVLAVTLAKEFGGVYANHDQLIWIGLFDFLQIGQGLQAIDAAVGPKVQQYELAAELFQLNGTFCVDPFYAADQGVRRNDLTLDRRQILRRLRWRVVKDRSNGDEAA